MCYLGRDAVKLRRQRCAQRILQDDDDDGGDAEEEEQNTKEIFDSYSCIKNKRKVAKGSQPQSLHKSPPSSSSSSTTSFSDGEASIEEKDNQRKRPNTRDVPRSHSKKMMVSKATTSPSLPSTHHDSLFLSDSLDTSQHQEECFICGLCVAQTSSSTAGQDTSRSYHSCTSCLRVYHTSCLSGVSHFNALMKQRKQEDDSKCHNWYCPRCLGFLFLRTITFYRYGKPTIPQPNFQLYLKETVGLTGYFQNCGRCGVSSSQRRVAVICDNCEREWHLRCLKLQDLPWGTWFCPDCIDLHICASCVLSTRESSTSILPEKESTRSLFSSEEEQTKKNESPNVTQESNHENGITIQYYHNGPLLKCWTCYLRFHPECVGKSYVPVASQPSVCCSSADDESCMGNQHKMGFWCCAACQEFLGIQRIISQRIGKIPSPKVSEHSEDMSSSQIELLVKFKTQSYRRLMWLPLERVKLIYPTGVRKWLATPEAAHLFSRLNKDTSNSGESSYDLESFSNEETHHHEEEEEDHEEDEDKQTHLSQNEKEQNQTNNKNDDVLDNLLESPKKEDNGLSDMSGTMHLESEEINLCQKTSPPFLETLEKDGFENSSDISPLNHLKEDGLKSECSEHKKKELCYNLSKKRVIGQDANLKESFIYGMKRPSCVKKEWLFPSRVFDKRFCLRGTTQIEYRVKWSCLSYEEATWESGVTIHDTSACKTFRAVTAVENIIKCKPNKIIRDGSKDPTLPDPLPYSKSNHPLPPKNTVLVSGTKYIIQTFPADSSDKDKAKPPNPLQQYNILSVEKCEEDTKAGNFVPYLDRPFFLNGYYLFDYQLEGINWLRYAWNKKRSVILADEMGLGKTIQMVSFLGSLWNDLAVQGPFLVVAPLATLEDVWVRELKHWVPFMNVVSYFGNPESRQICLENELFISGGPRAKAWYEGHCLAADRQPYYNRPYLSPRLPKLSDGETFAKFDVMITSYEMFRKDHWLFRQIQWNVIVVDEGHRLKNFDSEIKRSLESCTSRMRVLLTGTPLQNSIDELFSLLNVLHPEQFPESRKNEYQGVVTEESTIEKLKGELQLHILRRTKRDVMGGRMPGKKERLIFVENTPTQREMYRNIILRNHLLLSSSNPSCNVLTKRNVRAASLRNVVMQMRKCCNHPYLFDESPPVIRTEKDFQSLVEASGKLHLLDRMLQILLKGGHRVLVFSQFMRMLNILEEYLNYRRYGFERLDGSTSAVERQRAIDRFNGQPHKKFVFLLSTRAGGLGINLTSADTVIIYDSDWNPHNDLQAQARVHRLGQTKKVAIYRFMTRATVEERIIETARNKLVLDQVVAGRISLGDVDAMVRCGAQELFSEVNPSKQVHYDDAQLEQLLSRESDSDDDDAIKEGNLSIKETVLGSFKVARFYETSTEPTSTLHKSNAEFWDNLVKEKSFISQKTDLLDDTLIKSSDLQLETLGRGMRARKEVLHYNHFTCRETSLSSEKSDEARGDEDDNDDEDDDDDDDDDNDDAGDHGNADRTDEFDLEDRKLESHLYERSTNLTHSSKKGYSQGLRKGSVKQKKKLFCFFDLYGNSSNFWGRRQGAAFNATYTSVLPQFLDQIGSVRRQLGLAERSRLARRMFLSNMPSPSTDSKTFKCPTLWTSETTTTEQCHAFQLDWSKEWLKKILYVQLCNRTVPFQPYIVEHSQRYFLLSSPIILNPTGDISSPQGLPETAQLIALTMRELSSEEFLRWKTQLSNYLHRYLSTSCSNVFHFPESFKASLRATTPPNHAPSLSYLHPTYPDYDSVRKALQRRGKQQEL